MNDYNKVREAVAEKLYIGCVKWTCVDDYPKWDTTDESIREDWRKEADQILNIEVDGCKVMVVRLEGELPELRVDGVLRPDGRPLHMGWDKSGMEAQQDMLKANYYQAVEGGDDG